MGVRVTSNNGGEEITFGIYDTPVGETLTTNLIYSATADSSDADADAVSALMTRGFPDIIAGDIQHGVSVKYTQTTSSVCHIL